MGLNTIEELAVKVFNEIDYTEPHQSVGFFIIIDIYHYELTRKHTKD